MFGFREIKKGEKNLETLNAKKQQEAYLNITPEKPMTMEELKLAVQEVFAEEARRAARG